MNLYINVKLKLGRFALKFIRGDATTYMLGLSSGQWGSLAAIAVSLICMAVLHLRFSQINAHSAQTQDN